VSLNPLCLGLFTLAKAALSDFLHSTAARITNRVLDSHLRFSAELAQPLHIGGGNQIDIERTQMTLHHPHRGECGNLLMKKIEAIVKPFKLEEVKDALAEVRH